jgi:hypothetical protein
MPGWEATLGPGVPVHPTLESRKRERARAPGANGKEEYHEGGGVRPGLDLSAGQAPDD